MPKHARHFVSQRFGKSTVTVELGDDMAGAVAIMLPGPDQKTVQFSITPERMALVTGDPLLRPEKLMRIAIQQAHKQMSLKGTRGLFDAPIPLAIGGAQWLGDLTDERYGGATQGFDADLTPENA